MIKELAKATDAKIAQVQKERVLIISEIRLLRHMCETYNRPEDQAKWDAVIARNNALEEEYARLKKIYLEHRWSRFYLVAGPRGHIHSSMDCHSCYPDTEFYWLPELSGDTETDAVAAEGEILCTFCFPSAPVAWTEGVGRRTKEQRDAKDAEKAARAAAKAEKSLSLDGSVVSIAAPRNDGTDRHGEYKDFKTYKAAEIWAVEAVAKQRIVDAKINRYGVWFPDAYTVQNLSTVLEMMAAKKQVTVEQILADLEKRIAKKFAAEKEWHLS